jgi:CRP-like cAMP-binding protein
MSTVLGVSRTDDTNAHFRSVPIFAGCTETELAEIDRLADEVHVEAGRTIIREGDLGQEFALVISGEADIVKDGEAVARIGPGAYFGEVALLDSITRTASVVAVTDMTLEVIDRRGFNTLLDDLPSLSRAMLKGMAQRLAELEDECQTLRSAAGGA